MRPVKAIGRTAPKVYNGGMENLRVVVEMSRWLLDQLTGDPRDGLIHQGFEACGTREEFEEFLGSHSADPGIERIRQEWDDLARSTPPPVQHHRQVVLPDF